MGKWSGGFEPLTPWSRNSGQGLNHLSTAVFEGAPTVQYLLILAQCVHYVANWSPPLESRVVLSSKDSRGICGRVIPAVALAAHRSGDAALHKQAAAVWVSVTLSLDKPRVYFGVRILMRL